MAVQTIKLDYNPLPWQRELHLSNATFKCAVGGFGSGKTRWLIEEAIHLLLKYPNNYGVILRKTYPELDDTTKKLFLDRIPPVLIKDIKEAKREYTFVNNSKVIFRAFSDLNKIKNLDIGFFAIDQAEELSEPYFWLLASRFKLPYKHIKYEGLLAANPAGKNWIWRVFMVEKKDDPDFKIIISKTEDNKINLPEGYIERLKQIYPEKWIDRYLNASFDDFSGNVFYAYKSTCRQNLTDFKFNDSNRYKVYVAIDPGITNPTGVLFAAVDIIDHKIYVFDEIYETNQLPENIVFLIKRKIEKWQIEKVWQFLIDPAALQREMVSKKTLFNEYRKLGLNVIAADRNLQMGIIKVNKAFENNKIIINFTLTNLIREIEEYVWEEPKKVIEEGYNAPEKPKDKNNHLCDCLRYIVMNIPDRYIYEDVEQSEIERQNFIKTRYNIIYSKKRLTPY
ncbi:MAG: phage terminase large subunit [Candidatus Aenigmatarchaeota archaeon]